MEDKKTFPGIFVEALENTTAHGLPNLVRYKGIFRKLIWFLLFSGCFGMLVWICVDLLFQYWAYPTDTSVDVAYSPRLHFPAVTVCNMNPVRNSALNNLLSDGNTAGSNLAELLRDGSSTKKRRKKRQLRQNPQQPLLNIGQQNASLQLQNGSQSQHQQSWIGNQLNGSSFQQQISISLQQNGSNLLQQNGSQPQQNQSSLQQQIFSSQQQNGSLQQQILSNQHGNNGSDLLHQIWNSQQQNGSSLQQQNGSALYQNGSNLLQQISSSQQLNDTILHQQNGSAPYQNATENASNLQQQLESNQQIENNQQQPEDNQQQMERNQQQPGPTQQDGGQQKQGGGPPQQNGRPPSEVRTGNAVTRESFTRLFAQMSDDDRLAVGHNLSVFLLDCSFAGYPCTVDNFTTFSDSNYGNCFIFNSGIHNMQESHRPLTTSKAGHNYGLSLTLYIEQAEYLSSMSDAAGVRVKVHQQRRMPFPQDSSYAVSPGQYSSVALKKKSYIRQTPPYGNCSYINGTENVLKNAYANYYNLNNQYSDEACMKTCFQRHVIIECGCAHPSYPYKNVKAFPNIVSAGSGTNAVCDVVNNTLHDECVQNITIRYTEGVLFCDDECPPTCDEDTYPGGISTASWPSTNYLSELQEMLLEKDIPVPQGPSSMVEKWIRENVLKVDIFYADLNYEVVTSNIGYGLGDLGSDVGGNMGLWVGISCLTLCELLNIGIDILLWCFRKAGLKKNKTTDIKMISNNTFDTKQKNWADI